MLDTPSNELKAHLQLVPYLDTGVAFDAGELLTEALAVTKEFKDHRPDYQISSYGCGWRDFVIIEPPNPFLAPSDESSYNQGTSLTTSIGKCVKTLHALSRIVDLDRCMRVRYVVLEGGARIKPHRDTVQNPKTVIHLPLNAPNGCHFLTDLDGAGNAWSGSATIPFKPGRVYLVNVGTLHAVQNHSCVSRIHIIVEGPLLISEVELLKCARAQNKIYSATQLVSALLEKRLKQLRHE